MDNQNKSDFYLHSLMCLIGGFLGAYAIFNRCGNLGSAQTSNLIYVVLCFLGRNLKEFLLHFSGLILYFAAFELNCSFQTLILHLQMTSVHQS